MKDEEAVAYANTRISTSERTDALCRAWTRAEASKAAAFENYLAPTKAQLRQLVAQAWGPRGHVAEYRQACDDARRLDEDTLIREMDRAAAIGDTEFVKACGRAAFDRDLPDAMTAYLKENPGQTLLVTRAQELRDDITAHEHAMANPTSKPGLMITSRTHIEKPEAIRHLTDYQIAQRVSGEVTEVWSAAQSDTAADTGAATAGGITW
jgi:hypothetical protein